MPPTVLAQPKASSMRLRCFWDRAWLSCRVVRPSIAECRDLTTITGATSYDCGIAGEPSKFGGSLGVAASSTNRGVIGPQAFYADTKIRLTARGGSFTGGAVRIVIHTLTVGLPS